VEAEDLLEIGGYINDLFGDQMNNIIRILHLALAAEHACANDGAS